MLKVRVQLMSLFRDREYCGISFLVGFRLSMYVILLAIRAEAYHVLTAPTFPNQFKETFVEEVVESGRKRRHAHT